MDLSTIGIVIVLVGGILFLVFLLTRKNQSSSNRRSPNNEWNNPSWVSSNSQTSQSLDQTDISLRQQL
jgi:hypothetical protein